MCSSDLANAVVVSRGATSLVADTIGVVANEDWIKKNYDFIEKFATGIAEATFFVRKNPKESAEIATRFLDGSGSTGTPGCRSAPSRGWCAPATR